MKDKEKLMSFPCSYPLKVLGMNTNEFYGLVSAIIERHTGGNEITYSVRTSNGEKYMAVTATFTAESQEQLTNIYKELSEQPLVVMTL